MKNKGFSLIELLIVMAVSMILLTGAISVFSNQTKVYSGQQQQLNVIQDSRLAIDVLTTDIRMAGFKKNGATLTGISTATATSIRVLADLNQDGVITSGGDEDISYSYDVDTKILSRNNQEFLRNIETFNLSYTLADGSTTQAPSDLTKIRRIKVLDCEV